LLDFRRNPFDLGSSTTLKDLYERWYKTRIGKVSRFTLARYRTSWDYSSSIQNKRVCEIRISDLRNCIENGVILYAGKERHPENNAKDSIKALYNNLFDYAVACGIIDKNPARQFTIDSGYVRKPNSHIPYSDEEIEILWNSLDKSPVVDMILIQCYSGWRPGELCDLLVANVDLEHRTFTGGKKTKAETGRFRFIPAFMILFRPVTKKPSKSIRHIYLIICLKVKMPIPTTLRSRPDSLSLLKNST
jgi:integrase